MRIISNTHGGQLFFAFFIFLLSVVAVPVLAQNDSCRPPVNPAAAQYVIGYGSLMQTNSKNATYQGTSDNLPIILSGFQRGWFVRTSSAQQTVLGAIKNKEKHLNAVIFQLSIGSSISHYDQREAHYCRVLVSASAVHMLNQQTVPVGQIWIYIPKSAMVAIPSSHYPIMQSYVDIFLSGCLEIQNKYRLKDFAAQCVSTTSSWSPFWINDRSHPVRVLLYHPDYSQIDQLLLNKKDFIEHMR